MRRALPALGLALLVTGVASPALAVRAHDALAGRPALERFLTASGGAPADASVRGVATWDAVPRAMRAPFAALRADLGAGWRASFDARTGVPRRLYGPGVSAPGSVASAKDAEAAARTVLERHVALLAPGSKASDFQLVSNDLTGGMRTVGFAQRASGLRVLGGQVSFRFKNDQLFVIASEALPHVRVASPTVAVAPETAQARASAWIDEDFGAGDASSVGEPLVLAVSGGGRRIDYHVVRPVTVDAAPLRFTVYVDSASGRPVAREQTNRFASADVLGHVVERSPSFGPRYDAPLPLAKVNVEGAQGKTSALGALTWSGASPTPVEVFLDGDRARVLNDAGPELILNVDLSDTQAFTWDASAIPDDDAQLITFVHAGLVREYAKTFAPTQGFLNLKVLATVNIADICNAFSDGTTINFYQAGSGCENTGRLADVVYHEYGHSLHAHAIIEGAGAFDGALSEGVSDYLAATITGDPAMGRGFFMTQTELRHLDPAWENTWPDDLSGEVHNDGLIIGQALWDMRKALVAKLGQVEGVAHANVLYYEGIRRASDIPTMHVEVLAADDDDGDLTNGTPNVCEINAAFGQHGLILASGKSVTPAFAPPNGSGFQVTLELQGLFQQCSSDALGDAILTWKNRDQPAEQGTIVMQAEGNLLTATIPPQDAGTVVRYGVNLAFADGATLLFPENPADRWYEFFVGDVIPLYCTDFETDPAADGWTHGLAAGEPNEGADDWHWGEPNGTGSNGDPLLAFSGDKCFGNDLRPEPQYNGHYQADIQNWAKTPVIDVMGHQNVRLQYRRWLNVEDGHFDQGSILSNDQPVWTNLDSQQGDGSDTHHVDGEWRFSDVDLSSTISPQGTVQLTFQLTSDAGVQMGGWTIDDLCVVAYEGSGPVDPCAGGGGGGAPPATGGGDAAGGGPGDQLEPGGGCDCKHAGTSSEDPAPLAALGALALAFASRRRRAAR